MRKVIVSEWVTLDGVVQSPTGPGEDPSGGFRHGGWHVPHFEDPDFLEWLTDTTVQAGAYLFGRLTYDNFAAYWPTAPDEEREIRDALNARPKYVVSTTLAGPLPWQHSTLLRGDAARAVAALKGEPGGDLLVFGSTRLVRTLLEHGLVDEFRLMIDPVVVGGGKRIFHDDGVLRRLRLESSRSTPTGAVLATYRVAHD